MKLVASYSMVVGAVLVDLRKQRGLTQAEIAKRLGGPQSTWSRIENGKQAATIDQVALLCRELEVRVGEVCDIADRTCVELRQRGVEVQTQWTDDEYVRCPAHVLARCVHKVQA